MGFAVKQPHNGVIQLPFLTFHQKYACLGLLKPSEGRNCSFNRRFAGSNPGMPGHTHTHTSPMMKAAHLGVSLVLRSPSTTSNSGYRRLTATPVKTSTSSWLVTSVTLRQRRWWITQRLRWGAPSINTAMYTLECNLYSFVRLQLLATTFFCSIQRSYVDCGTWISCTCMCKHVNFLPPVL